ncbi:hypothetical protein [Edwardsiella phage vB_EtaM_ET-ABTNL-9]|nr:hypothetical protein [Edwardsiella phage vB_EtaM_ET-ABTNL-9]
MTIYATVKTLKAGFPSDKEAVKSLGFKVGDKFEVESISVGQSSTGVYLKEFPSRCFNSVFFNFEEDGTPLDIFSDDRFNSYKYF